MAKSHSKLTSEQLVELSRQGDGRAFDTLIVRFLPLIRYKAQRYYAASLERDDLVQEGLLGLLKAVRAYDGVQSGFATFATVCISNKILSAIKLALSAKHLPMRDYMPLYQDESISSVQGTAGEDPESYIIMQENRQELHQRIETLLSSFERQALKLYLSGYTYSEISDTLHSSPKAIDNALQRVRGKLKAI